jgi:peptidoglycan hydrolase-like protein with peptidoglycan-binding domain
MSHLRTIAATCAVTSMLVLPAFASAQTANASITSLQQELQSLIDEITQLQQAATSSPAVTATVPVASAPASSNIICPTLIRTLSLGDSGTDVANLQGFLAQNPLIYPEQSVTGYFSMYTQDAVQRWQTAYNIVSSGDPSTTGYGVVGPHTRAAILASCTNAAGTSGGQSTMLTGSNSTTQSLCPVAPQPATPCPGTWSPLTNATGCTIAWQCAVPLGQVATTTVTTTTVATTTTAATSSSACAPYTLPACIGGTVTWLGMSVNNCNLGYQCVIPGR